MSARKLKCDTQPFIPISELPNHFVMEFFARKMKMRDFLRVIFKQYETLYCTVFDQLKKLELCEICLCKASVDVVSRSLGFSIISYRNHQFSCLTCQWTDIGVMVGMNKYSHGKSGLMTCCPFNNNSMRSCSIFARRPKLQ